MKNWIRKIVEATFRSRKFQPPIWLKPSDIEVLGLLGMGKFKHLQKKYSIVQSYREDKSLSAKHAGKKLSIWGHEKCPATLGIIELPNGQIEIINSTRTLLTYSVGNTFSINAALMIEPHEFYDYWQWGHKAQDFFYKPPDTKPLTSEAIIEKGLVLIGKAPEHILDRLNISQRQLDRSTHLWGATYNEIGPYRFPVLGKILKSGTSPSATFKVNAQAYVPAPGITSFEGVTGTPDGTITFHTSSSSTHPALILTEDIQTIAALVFIEESTPEFDLPQSPLLGNSYPWQINQKRWSPAWLEHTELGNTLYITDKLIGNFYMYTNESLAASVNSRDDPLTSDFMDAVKQAKAMPLPTYEDHAITFCLHPRHGAKEKHPAITHEGKLTVLTHNVSPRIRGWFNDQILVNDSRYAHGALANCLTERYNQLTALIPVYERYRQLMNMYSAVSVLKEKGFTPDPEFVEELRVFVNRKKMQEPVSSQNKYVNFTPV